LLGSAQHGYRGRRALSIIDWVRGARVLVFAMLAIGVAAAHAQAAFPGENGEIASIYDDFEIRAVASLRSTGRSPESRPGPPTGR
jgi:hypothetical protein